MYLAAPVSFAESHKSHLRKRRYTLTCSAGDLSTSEETGDEAHHSLMN